jgi:hypothetical protein
LITTLATPLFFVIVSLFILDLLGLQAHCFNESRVEARRITEDVWSVDDRMRQNIVETRHCCKGGGRVAN